MEIRLNNPIKFPYNCSNFSNHHLYQIYKNNDGWMVTQFTLFSLMEVRFYDRFGYLTSVDCTLSLFDIIEIELREGYKQLESQRVKHFNQLNFVNC